MYPNDTNLQISQGHNLIASLETQYPRRKQSEFDRFTSELIFTDEKEFYSYPYGID